MPITRSDYGAIPCVQGLVRSIRTAFEPGIFHHQYAERRTEIHRNFSSLRDAAAQYSYGGADFGQTQLQLDDLRRRLRTAHRRSNSEQFLFACRDLMVWGGTSHGNTDWLEAEHKNGTLLSHFKKAKKSLGNPELDLDDLPALRSNAGLAKLHSLLLDEFVIYDSRVAAALCLFVARYCMYDGRGVVPNELSFRTLPPRGQTARVPMGTPYQFQGLSGDQDRTGPQHLRSNVMANWVLSAAIGSGTFFYQCPQTDLRALEAALFMVGYDLSHAELGH